MGLFVLLELGDRFDERIWSEPGVPDEEAEGHLSFLLNIEIALADLGDVPRSLDIDAGSVKLGHGVLGEVLVERAENLWCDVVQCAGDVPLSVSCACVRDFRASLTCDSAVRVPDRRAGGR